MQKFTFSCLQAFKGLLASIQQSTARQGRVPIFGLNSYTGQSFCRYISLKRNTKKLLSVSAIEIHPITFYPNAAKAFRSFLQSELNVVSSANYYMDNARWLHHYVNPTLYIIHLIGSTKHYYILCSVEDICTYRNFRYNNNG